MLYWIVSSLGAAICIAYLGREVNSVFSKFDFYTIEGIAFLITALWTYLTKDDFYKDKEGNKQKMDTVNSFAFIKMDIWAIIFLALGMFLHGNLIFHYLPKSSV